MDDHEQETVRHGPAVEMAKTEATGQQSEPARKSKRAAPLMRERRSWSWRSLLAGGIGLLLAFVLVLHFGRLLTLPRSGHNAHVTIAGGIAYVGTTDLGVYALRDGKVLWHSMTKGDTGGQPEVVNGIVYVSAVSDWQGS